MARASTSFSLRLLNERIRHLDFVKDHEVVRTGRAGPSRRRRNHKQHRAAIEKQGWPTHQLIMTFDPQRLYYWVEALFPDPRKAFPDRAPTTIGRQEGREQARELTERKTA